MKRNGSRRQRLRGGLVLKLLILLALLAALAVGCWILFLPRLVANQIRDRTGFEVKMDVLAVNPFTADIEIKGLVVKNPPGWPAADFLDVREFRADASLFSLWGNRLVLNEVVIDVTKVSLVRNESGSLNADFFREALNGRPTAGLSAPAAKDAPKREFLIKHLMLKFDQLAYADYSGRRPVMKEYRLGLQRDMRDVDSVAKLMAPFRDAALGSVADALGGLLGKHPDLLKDLPAALQDAGHKAGEKLKGLLDSLDKRKP